MKNRRYLYRLVPLLLLLLSGCGANTPQLRPLPKDAVILAFGDSLTYGTGAPKAKSYPADLARLSGRKVINAGVPGEVSAAGVKRLPALLDEYQPNLLILCHGGNDLLRRMSVDALEQNLREMIEIARGRGIPVVLIAVPQPKLLLLHADEVYPRLAEHYHLPFAPDLLADIESDRRLKSDAVHPNAAGYQQLAEGVYQLLRDSGAL